VLALPNHRRAGYPVTITFDAFTKPFRARAAGGNGRGQIVRNGSRLSTWSVPTIRCWARPCLRPPLERQPSGWNGRAFSLQCLAYESGRGTGGPSRCHRLEFGTRSHDNGTGIGARTPNDPNCPLVNSCLLSARTVQIVWAPSRRHLHCSRGSVHFPPPRCGRRAGQVHVPPGRPDLRHERGADPLGAKIRHSRAFGSFLSADGQLLGLRHQRTSALTGVGRLPFGVSGWPWNRSV